MEEKEKMETFGDKLKKSKKEWSDQGMRFFADTKEASKGFATFVSGEAKEWGEFLREHYKEIENQGREILRPATDTGKLKAQIDTIVAKVKGREQEAATEQEAAEENEETNEDATPQAEA
jgi:hypothetical protein